MRIIIFGSDGQVGCELRNLARRRHIDSVGVTRAQADITDSRVVSDVLSTSEAGVVVNLAAYTKVDVAEREKEAAWRANCYGPSVLAEACGNLRLPLIHLSTDYVFDGSKSGPYLETDAVAPLGVYGVTKEAGERAVRGGCERHLIVRTAWVYGVYGNNFLKTMLRLAEKLDGWGVVNDQVGNPTATPDLAEAILAVASRAVHDDCPWGTYHFAGTGEASWFEFATAIMAARQKIAGAIPTIRPISTAEYPTAAPRPANSQLDSSQFARMFGYRARPWRERIEPTVRAAFQDMFGAAST